MISQPMKEIKVYQASIFDLEKIVELFDLYRQFYGQKSDPNACRSYLRERLIHRQSFVFYAITQDHHPVGFIQLYPSFSSISMKHLLILNDLYVKESYRRERVAERLFYEVIAFAKEMGSKGLTLSTAFDNLAAQALYQKFGFVKEEEFQSMNLIF